MNVVVAVGHDEAQITTNIAELIELRAKRHPAAAALIALDRVWTHRELGVAVHAIARRLLDSGVQPAQRVGVSMMQTPLHLMTLLAIARIGAVSVPLHVAFPPTRRLALARRYEVRAIVSGRSEFRLDGVPFIDLSSVDLGAAVAPLPAWRGKPDDPCRIVLSSGTTGESKAVMYSYRHMLDRTRDTIQSFMVDSRSRFMPMDLNFAVGFVYAMGAMLEGGAVVLGRTGNADEMFHQVRLHAVTHWMLSPSIAAQIARWLPDDDTHFPTLIQLRIVGAKPGRELLETLFARFTPNVFEHYGLTEMGIAAVATPELLRRVPDTAGRILPSFGVQVVDEDDRPVPAGQTGHLRLKTPWMLDGYYENPEKTAYHFRHGWYYPGDLAHIDTDGLLFLTGRADDVINVAGAKFDPHEIQQGLQAHPMVREAAAFALPQPDGNAALAAAVMVAGHVSVDELHAWARVQLGLQCPDRLFIVDDLPRTPTGKIQRERIPAMFASRPVVQGS